jgi:hypothetical protein
VSSPSHSNDNPDVHLVEDELREGLATSRQIVHQSRYLIALSESDSSWAEEGGGREAAN